MDTRSRGLGRVAADPEAVLPSGDRRRDVPGHAAAAL